MSAFLTREEIIDLTGYKVRPKQIEWLLRNGVRHWVPATGWPIVPRSAIDGTGNSKDDPQPPKTPRYAA
jgi:hypothetical protein